MKTAVFTAGQGLFVEKEIYMKNYTEVKLLGLFDTEAEAWAFAESIPAELTNHDKLTMVERVVEAGHPAVIVTETARATKIIYNGYTVKIAHSTGAVTGDIDIVFDAVINNNHWADAKLATVSAGAVIDFKGSMFKVIRVSRPDHRTDHSMRIDCKRVGAGNYGTMVLVQRRGTLARGLR